MLHITQFSFCFFVSLISIHVIHDKNMDLDFEYRVPLASLVNETLIYWMKNILPGKTTHCQCEIDKRTIHCLTFPLEIQTEITKAFPYSALEPFIIYPESKGQPQ